MSAPRVPYLRGVVSSMDYEPLVAIPENMRVLPTGDVIDSLPFEAPWIGPLGACLINITALRYADNGTVECQLGDERGVPYHNGSEWRAINKFPSEWPQ